MKGLKVAIKEKNEEAEENKATNKKIMRKIDLVKCSECAKLPEWDRAICAKCMPERRKLSSSFGKFNLCREFGVFSCEYYCRHCEKNVRLERT